MTLPLYSRVAGKLILWVTGLSLYETQLGKADRSTRWWTDVRWYHHTPLGLDYRYHCIEIIVRTNYVKNIFLGRIVVTSVPIRGNDRYIFTNVNTVSHLTYDCKFGHEAVSQGNLVGPIFTFLVEYIGQIYFAWDMLESRKFGLHGLAYFVLAHV